MSRLLRTTCSVVLAAVFVASFMSVGASARLSPTPAAIAGAGAATSTVTAPPSGGDRTGVTRDLIKIGMHAPITGAAPVPAQAMQDAKDIYFRWLEKKGIQINDRDVTVVLKNDNYNPSQAVEVCREMVEQEKVFLLVGFTGAPQIQACARYAASVGVPYVSPGSMKSTLANLENYFATTMTDPQQARLLADYLVTKLGAKEEQNGVVWVNSPAYADGHDAFVAEMADRDATVDYDRPIPITAGASDAQTVATELNAAGIDNVLVLSTPTFLIQLAQAAANQDYFPRWLLIGPLGPLDTVANVACRNNDSLDRARSISPWPAYADRDEFDPRFDRARKAFNASPSEITWYGWAHGKTIAKLLRLPGRNLTRERFIYFAQRARIKTGIGPKLRYRPWNHLGARQTHVLKLFCDQERWRTIRRFVSDF